MAAAAVSWHVTKMVILIIMRKLSNNTLQNYITDINIFMYSVLLWGNRAANSCFMFPIKDYRVLLFYTSALQCKSITLRCTSKYWMSKVYTDIKSSPFSIFDMCVIITINIVLGKPYIFYSFSYNVKQDLSLFCMKPSLQYYGQSCGSCLAAKKS